MALWQPEALNRVSTRRQTLPQNGLCCHPALGVFVSSFCTNSQTLLHPPLSLANDYKQCPAWQSNAEEQTLVHL